jgi:tetraacyldisaccharide 4'-kinase
MRLVADVRRVCDEAPLATPLAGPVDALAGIGHPPRFFATLRGSAISWISGWPTAITTPSIGTSWWAALPASRC